MIRQSKNRLNRKCLATSSAHFDCSIFGIEIERCFAACVVRIAPAMAQLEVMGSIGNRVRRGKLTRFADTLTASAMRGWRGIALGNNCRAGY
jgi:hypothetical protein